MDKETMNTNEKTRKDWTELMNILEMQSETFELTEEDKQWLETGTLDGMDDDWNWE